jgi:hypothetical protein
MGGEHTHAQKKYMKTKMLVRKTKKMKKQVRKKEK